MQDRSTGARAKPMTATATSMVKAIWQSYFPSTAPEGTIRAGRPAYLLCYEISGFESCIVL